MKKQNKKIINKFKFNKLLSMLVLGGLVLSGSPVHVFANDRNNEYWSSDKEYVQAVVQFPIRNFDIVEDENIIYVLNNMTRTAAVVDVNITEEDMINDLVIPDVLIRNRTRYRITEIRENAFDGCIKLSGKLTIGNNITSIGNNAFRGCENLNNITIGKSVCNIGFGAFENCSGLKFVGIEDYEGARKIMIREWAFKNCSNLEEVNIPLCEIRIGASAFENCDQFKFTTHPGVKDIRLIKQFYDGGRHYFFFVAFKM